MSQPTRTIRETYSVANIQYQASADTLQKRISSLRGIISCEVSSASGTLTVEYDTESISNTEITQEIQACGYTVYKEEENHEMIPVQAGKYVANSHLVFIIAASFGIAFTHVLHLPQWIGLLLLSLSMIASYPVLKSTLKSLYNRRNPANFPNIITAVLSAIAGVILFFRNNPDSLLFCFTSAVIFSACAVAEIMTSFDQKKDALTTGVQNNIPKEAAVFQNHVEHRIDVSRIQKDQIVFIRPGEIIPVDGKVVNGFALVDTSQLTGNDTPIEKSKSTYVYAGSKCLKGSIEIRAMNLGSSTAMMRLAKMAETTANDPSYSSPFQKFSIWLLFYILITACIALAGWKTSDHTITFALFTAIAVLSCGSIPSLRISSEKNVLNAARYAAKNYIYFQSVKSLELLSRTDILFVDEEGVLTDPDLIVTDFMPLNDVTNGRLEYIAYALESRHDDSFAKAITRYLKTRKISSVNKQEFYHLSSVGRSEFPVMNHCISGTKEALEEKGIDVSQYHRETDHLSAQGKQLLFFAENKKVIGIVAAIHKTIPGTEIALRQLEEKDILIHVFSSASRTETEHLKKELNLTSVIQTSTDKEQEQYMSKESDKDAIVTYISNQNSTENHDVDIQIVIDKEMKLHNKSVDIVLVRNQLSDLIKAINISSATYEQIQRSQLAIILYHIAVILSFAFILPRFLNPWITIILSNISSLLCLHLAITNSKGPKSMH